MLTMAVLTESCSRLGCCTWSIRSTRHAASSASLPPVSKPRGKAASPRPASGTRDARGARLAALSAAEAAGEVAGRLGGGAAGGGAGRGRWRAALTAACRVSVAVAPGVIPSAAARAEDVRVVGGEQVEMRSMTKETLLPPSFLASLLSP